MDQSTLYISVMAAVIVLGIVFTVVYYFARYYVKAHEGDQDVIPSLRDVSPQALKKPPAAGKAGPRDLREALKGTREGFWGRIQGQLSAASSQGEISDSDLDQLEEVLFTSDLGPQTAQALFVSLGDQLRGSAVNAEAVRSVLKGQMLRIFEEKSAKDPLLDHVGAEASKPVVWMVVGVNGAGKTTTIGKLASKAGQMGLKVLIVAGDTFRAAADKQLEVWAERAGAAIHMAPETKDPAAVAYSGLEKAKSEGYDLVIVDTAGRLHTQEHLMEELKKVKRVMTKVVPEAPHQTLLVIDANSGQNALAQARHFNQALQLTGVALTKLDGTSKGGIALGVVWELGIPVRYIGVGESVEDLREFEPKQFVDSIL